MTRVIGGPADGRDVPYQSARMVCPAPVDPARYYRKDEPLELAPDFIYELVPHIDGEFVYVPWIPPSERQ